MDRIVLPGKIKHGVAAYRRGCRCDDCREAKRLAQRRFVARRKIEGRPVDYSMYRRLDYRACEGCGETYEARSDSHSRFCSLACANRAQRAKWGKCTDLVHVGPKVTAPAPATAPVTVVTSGRTWRTITSGPCGWCGEPFTSTAYGARYCSGRCSRRASEARQGRFVVPDSIRRAIYERDNWTCQICHEPVEPDANPLSDWFPSLDHIVPRSQGGSDDDDNLRTAHRWCNAVRGDLTYYTDADLTA